MAQEVGVCSGCGGPLSKFEWNSSADVAVCTDAACRQFRHPIPLTRARILTLTEELAPVVRRRGRRMKIILPEEFTDEQTSSPTLEDLRRLRERIFSQKEDTEVL